MIIIHAPKDPPGSDAAGAIGVVIANGVDRPEIGLALETNDGWQAGDAQTTQLRV